MRLALIDPSESDARWLQIAVAELRADILVEHFAKEVEALTRFTEGHTNFEAILLDERPAILTLRETLEELAANPSVARVPIVVLLGSATTLPRVPRGRVFRCLQKPIDSKQLGALIHLLRRDQR